MWVVLLLYALLEEDESESEDIGPSCPLAHISSWKDVINLYDLLG